MKAEQLYINMYSFYQQGNSLETMHQWLRSSYGNDAGVLMSGFMKKYAHDEKLKSDFNKSCFI